MGVAGREVQGSGPPSSSQATDDPWDPSKSAEKCQKLGVEMQGRFNVGEGQFPQTSVLPPNVTWNTLWRTQSIDIGAKISQNTFLAGVPPPTLLGGRSRRSPDPLVGWGKNTPPILLHLVPRLDCHSLPSVPRFGGGALTPNIFCLESPTVEMMFLSLYLH